MGRRQDIVGPGVIGRRQDRVGPRVIGIHQDRVGPGVIGRRQDIVGRIDRHDLFITLTTAGLRELLV